jgi:hypothetical protein
VISSGGVQVLDIQPDDSQNVTIGYYDQSGEFRISPQEFCIACYFPTGNHWSPAYGYGRVRFVRFVLPDMPKSPEIDGWMSEAAHE